MRGLCMQYPQQPEEGATGGCDDTQFQVLIESEQMRKEADDSGPLTELEHWKRMSAKFNFIIEQIKGSNCKAVINVLNVAHSKLLKVNAVFFNIINL